MHVIPATVPGTGILHHIRTRRGQRFGVFTHISGARTLYIYSTPPDTADPGHDTAPDNPDPDNPAASMVLDRDEADQLAQLLHDQPISDRLAALERRLVELTPPGDTHHSPAVSQR
ncbi:hypothetical protein [Actinomadura rudentiformis]|uniref:Potassium/proton antiporter subunit KhtT-like N-terminal domain-containing protein n=1 Tax=Actinomadura rudentiformis TaxID=359158 RepID=A0A6H9YNY8_9ACTN|nr:hypothetical protein [Actinomadura rudentiformis]KAB2341620.1 hypothetical protein F8566_41555 [Actinomadura rudentiformis]